MSGCTDGTFKTTGDKHFTCTFGHGLYYPLASVRPDERFGPVSTSQGNRECELKSINCTLLQLRTCEQYGTHPYPFSFCIL